MNELRETQERILAEIEQTLAEVRVPQPETRAVFRGNCGHLEQVIAGVGEVVRGGGARCTPIPRDETNHSCREERTSSRRALVSLWCRYR